MTAILQPFSRVFAENGHAYMKARGRPPVPYNPDVPVVVKHSQLTKLRVQNNGIGGPVDPEDPGTVEDRDVTLKPWYGKLGSVKYPGTPYARTGPTKDQTGCQYALSELTEFNPASTQNLSITTPVTWYKMRIHGRITVSGAGQINAKQCVFDGPADPTASFISGETAIIDFNSAGSTTMSLLQDCTIAPRIPNPRMNGTKGGRHKVERCHIFWVTDGVGPYTTPGQTWPTGFELVGTRIEGLVYWPGQYYANRTPAYWDGAAYSTAGAGTVARSAADGKVTGRYDTVHNDGNHNDAIEIHNGFGTHTFNSTTELWTGNGVHVWGNAMINSDAYGQPNPSTLSLTVPNLGRGDNPRRGLPGGGQKPGVNSYTTWEKPLIGTVGPQYPAQGVSIFVGHVTGVAFEGPTTVLIHGNYINGGAGGMQEQAKGLPYIQFYFYDNIFGPDYYAWATTNDRDMYVVRLNDYTTANAMPNFATGPVRIPNHPKTGTPPFGTGGNNTWYDPNNKLGGNRDGQPVGLGSSSVPGLRVI